ncbi:MAG: long-chain fatty acid--CoA ligase [Desulfarculaceae bacterium]|nr:long-chain fatty acid--CoA ligase [Desulfarculaceae bacterium]MCF8071563.1 long-chain fatty acid--CoA ligase [Desulfarculaceae bacterium]MCF8102378.1 long-chain fatty acid--CoA ligase [Desulfarculaceae bacterium]MCF8114842.1 long-chain fatty acid--CoA ligase [Desulfarculaceae bacterium]
MTITEFVKAQAAKFGDRTYLLGEGGPITYGQFDQITDRLAARLAGLGLQPGDRVATLHPNSPQLLLAYFAIIKAGCVVVPVNPIYTAREIAHILGDSGAKAVIVHQDWAQRLQEVGDDAPDVEQVVVRPDGENLELTLERECPEPAPGYAPPDMTPQMPALTFYTSGTTGKPKGVVLTHRNLTFGGPNVAQNYGLRAEDVTMAALPMVHIFCIASPFMGAFSSGGSVVVVDGFKSEEVLAAIAEHRVTWFPGVPTMFTYLLNTLDQSRHDVSSLRMGLSGGASLPVEVLRQWEERFGAEIIEVYGLTESTGLVTGNPVYGLRKPGSIGVNVSGVDARVLDDQGGEVPIGEVGHLVFRGPNATRGYHNLPEVTAERIKHGWVYTGDHAYRDEDGYYFLVGREAELIITGGYNVYPREVEEVLYACPGVSEAAVIGGPHPSKGEVPMAFVVVHQDADPDEEAILAHCRGCLAPYKMPVIRFLDELPKNPTGKIMKKDLPRS